MSHEDLIRAEFGKQAVTFEDPRYSFGDGRLIEWFTGQIPLQPDMTVLEIAAGTGHIARALAPVVRQVIALDLTPEMLALGHNAARSTGIANVLFERGDAAALPYVDGSFDAVVTRFAIHHFEKPEVQLREMARVCAAGGTVAIMDIVAAEPLTSDLYNHVERLRDSSHTQALTLDELQEIVTRVGLTITHEASFDHVMDCERWLAQADAAPDTADAIRTLLRAELAGGAPTGMRPTEEAGRLFFTHRYQVVIAGRDN